MMGADDTRTSDQGRSDGPAEKLKWELHAGFIRHVDLFCIFWLVANDKLAVYNQRSHKHILDKLNAVIALKPDGSTAHIGSLEHDLGQSSWLHTFRRFAGKLRLKFGLTKPKSSKLESLTPEAFEACAGALGRKPFGLRSVIRGCTCKSNTEDVDDARIKSELEKFSRELTGYERLEVGKCEAGNCHRPLVGLVAPFVLHDHGEQGDDGRSPKRRRTESSDSADDFRINQKFYSGPVYALDPFIGDHNEECSSEELSVRVADLLFELVNVVIEDPKNTQTVSRGAWELAQTLKSKVEQTQGNVESESLSQVTETYGKLMEKAAELKPFPTTYWLVDRELTAKTSRLEGAGVIRDVQKLIDREAKRYDEGETGPEFVRAIVADNLRYLLRRFELVHPLLVEALYNGIANLNAFAAERAAEYVQMKPEQCPNLAHSQEKALAILNTLRTHGMGGTKNFLHIKCLHTILAFEIAEGAQIGALVSNLVF